MFFRFNGIIEWDVFCKIVFVNWYGIVLLMYLGIEIVEFGDIEV